LLFAAVVNSRGITQTPKSKRNKNRISPALFQIAKQRQKEQAALQNRVPRVQVLLPLPDVGSPKNGLLKPFLGLLFLIVVVDCRRFRCKNPRIVVYLLFETVFSAAVYLEIPKHDRYAIESTAVMFYTAISFFFGLKISSSFSAALSSADFIA